MGRCWVIACGWGTASARPEGDTFKLQENSHDLPKLQENSHDLTTKPSAYIIHIYIYIGSTRLAASAVPLWAYFVPSHFPRPVAEVQPCCGQSMAQVPWVLLVLVLFCLLLHYLSRSFVFLKVSGM